MVNEDQSPEHYEGQRVIEKSRTRVTDEEGQHVFRTVRVLEDGSRVVEEKPVKKNRKKASAVDPHVQVEIDSDIEQQANSNKNGKKKKGKKKKSSTRTTKASSEVPDVQAEFVSDDANHQSYSNFAPETAKEPTTFPMVPYAAPPPVQPVTQQPFFTFGGQQLLVYQVPYEEDRKECCGLCSCVNFWGVCCIITIILVVVLWIVIQRLVVRTVTDAILEDDY
eukprot:Nitzschia sp. Nitz4//scaffold362_size15054//1250//1915//NITZ4_008898-RA/size15054-processed-gene-0.7-mRNA-1//-1//CDS//3329549238//446//frame0